MDKTCYILESDGECELARASTLKEIMKLKKEIIEEDKEMTESDGEIFKESDIGYNIYKVVISEVTGKKAFIKYIRR